MCTESLFKLFGKEVYPYGVWIAVGILVCFLVLFLFTKKKGVPNEIQDYVFFVAIFAIIIGFFFAHLFQVFYNWLETGEFNFYKGGITVMGGLVGGAAAFLGIYFGAGKFVFKKDKLGLHKKYFNEILLIAPLCIVVAHAFGRIGCMCAGCCYGAESDSFLAIYNAGAYRLPVQLFEAAFLFALFGVLTYFYFKRCTNTFSIYLISYAIWRFIIEFFRDDARGGAVDATFAPSQWMSVLFIVIGVALLVFYKIRKVPFFEKVEKESK